MGEIPYFYNAKWHRKRVKAAFMIAHYLPILSTLFCVYFTWQLVIHSRATHWKAYLIWWTFGVICYGGGTLIESFGTLLGWNGTLFKAWYVLGALLGGAPLAQGTVHLLMKDGLARKLSILLAFVLIITASMVVLSPLDAQYVGGMRPSGKALVWSWIRWLTPFINIYAFIFLAGGAAWSAWRYFRKAMHPHLVQGNVLIAIGALLPGIGGASAKAGYVEVLYITELLGILLIYAGYLKVKQGKKVTAS